MYDNTLVERQSSERESRAILMAFFYGCKSGQLFSQILIPNHVGGKFEHNSADKLKRGATRTQLITQEGGRTTTSISATDVSCRFSFILLSSRCVSPLRITDSNSSKLLLRTFKSSCLLLLYTISIVYRVQRLLINSALCRLEYSSQAQEVANYLSQATKRALSVWAVRLE